MKMTLIDEITNLTGLDVDQVLEYDLIEDWTEISGQEVSFPDFMIEFLIYYSQDRSSVNWTDVMSCYQVSEWILSKYITSIGTSNLWAYRRNLSEEFIRKHMDKIDWPQLMMNQKNISWKLIEENLRSIGKSILNQVYRMPEWFMDKYFSIIFRDLEEKADIKLPENLSSQFIRANWNNMPLGSLIRRCKIPSDVIDEMIQSIETTFINELCIYQTLTEEQMIDAYIQTDGAARSNISGYQKLSEKFITKYPEIIRWACLAVNEKTDLSVEFLEQNYNNLGLYMSNLIGNPRTPMEFIDLHYSKIHLNTLITFGYPTAEILKNHLDDINWRLLSGFSRIPREIIDKYPEHLDWIDLTSVMANKWTPDDIDKYSDWLNWNVLIVNKEGQKLPDWLIRKYANRLDWKLLGKYVILSEPIVKEFQDRIDSDELRPETLDNAWKFILGPEYKWGKWAGEYSINDKIEKLWKTYFKKSTNL